MGILYCSGMLLNVQSLSEEGNRIKSLPNVCSANILTTVDTKLQKQHHFAQKPTSQGSHSGSGELLSEHHCLFHHCKSRLTDLTEPQISRKLCSDLLPDLETAYNPPPQSSILTVPHDWSRGWKGQCWVTLQLRHTIGLARLLYRDVQIYRLEKYYYNSIIQCYYDLQINELNISHFNKICIILQLYLNWLNCYFLK